MHTSTSPTVPDVLDAITANVYRFNNERELQEGLAAALHAAGVHAAREVALSPHDRIDFLCGSVGVEVKVKGPWIAVAQQMQRYAESDRVDSLLLVTTVYDHRRLEALATLGGKPITVHLLGGHL